MPTHKYPLSLQWLAICFSLIGALTVVSCLQPPGYPVEPVLTFIGLSKDTLLQSFTNKDTVTVLLEFTDGDGDISSPGSNSLAGIYLRNIRTNETKDTFRLDEIEPIGLENGIQGEVALRVFTTCCDYPPEVGQFPCEESQRFPVDVLELEAYMVDQAGNESNRVLLAPIYIRCDTLLL